MIASRPPASRKGTRWDQVLLVLVAYRLIAPGAEWRLHREWYGRSALADLLGGGASVGQLGCRDRRGWLISSAITPEMAFTE